MKVFRSVTFIIFIKYVFGLTLASTLLFPFNLAEQLIGNPIAVFGRALGENPLVKTVSNLAGDVTALAGRSLTEVPLAIARSLEGNGGSWLRGARDYFNSPLGVLRETLSNNFGEIDAFAYDNEDAKLSIEQLISKYGYPVETHEVQTEDGYILTLHRIPNGRDAGNNSSNGRRVAFLMHGLLSSSDDWIITGPEQSLGYILADAGYDVWIGNARGNVHSRRHIDLNPTQQVFWQFSWDEIGRLDLPAMIDYVLDTTGEEQLFYVGHSQGTTVFFVMCSLRPEYNGKIRIMFALSPVAWMTNVISPFVRMLAPGTDIIGWVLENIGVGEFLPNNVVMKIAGGLLCSDRSITQAVCSNALFLTCGFDLDQLNSTILPVIAGHSPAGASVRQLIHFGQGVLSGGFRRFDYGNVGNMQHYGSLDPPAYDLEAITAPVSLLYSRKDWMAHPDDVDTLYNNLNSAVDIYEVPHSQFNHLDFMWATRVREIIYQRIMNIMEDF